VKRKEAMLCVSVRRLLWRTRF